MEARNLHFPPDFLTSANRRVPDFQHPRLEMNTSKFEKFSFLCALDRRNGVSWKVEERRWGKDMGLEEGEAKKQPQNLRWTRLFLYKLFITGSHLILTTFWLRLEVLDCFSWHHLSVVNCIVMEQTFFPLSQMLTTTGATRRQRGMTCNSTRNVGKKMRF